MSGQFELTNVSQTILAEIADQKFKQRHVATTYALAIKSPEPIRWEEINQAIINRWSVAGLERIKTMAWALTA
jgi:threonine synthase